MDITPDTSLMDVDENDDLFYLSQQPATQGPKMGWQSTQPAVLRKMLEHNSKSSATYKMKGREPMPQIQSNPLTPSNARETSHRPRARTGMTRVPSSSQIGEISRDSLSLLNAQITNNTLRKRDMIESQKKAMVGKRRTSSSSRTSRTSTPSFSGSNGEAPMDIDMSSSSMPPSRTVSSSFINTGASTSASSCTRNASTGSIPAMQPSVAPPKRPSPPQQTDRRTTASKPPLIRQVSAKPALTTPQPQQRTPPSRTPQLGMRPRTGLNISQQKPFRSPFLRTETAPSKPPDPKPIPTPVDDPDSSFEWPSFDCDPDELDAVLEKHER